MTALPHVITCINARDVDLARGMITNGGAPPFPLRPRTLAVLKMLAASPGALVSKDDLMTAVWPGVTVTDDSLVQCVTEIRKALGDEDHKIIKTVPRRGHVFEPGSETAPAAKPPAAKTRVGLIAAGLAVLAAIAAFVWFPRAAPVPGHVPSIAVLPFDDMSDGKSLAYLADAMTEDVITDLSHSKEMLVIARNSTEVYKGKPVDIRQVGRDLNVLYVLEGTVQSAGGRMRATAQLIDATSGSHVWSERYERPAGDMFAIEAEITERIAATLIGYEGIVAGAGRRIAKRKPPQNLTAFDLYLLGIEAKHEVTPESLAKAEELLNKAIALDPNFARAHIGLGWVYAYDISLGLADPVASTVEKMLAAGQKAVALDPEDGEAHAVLGQAYVYRGEPDKAVGAFERAEALAPNNADILITVAWAWPNLGRPEHAVEMADRALRLNPRYPYWYIQGLAAIYFFGKNFEKSLNFANRVTSPFASDFAMIAVDAAYLGRSNEAKTAADKITAADAKWSAEQWMSDIGGFAREEDAEFFGEGVRKAGGRACLSAAEVKKRPATLKLKSCDAERAKAGTAQN